MAIKKVYLTTEGARVSAYCQHNEIKVNFLSIGMGSGENYNPTEAVKMTDEKLTVPIQSCKRIESNHYKIRAEFSNDILESNLLYREVCLYCEDPESTGKKVMYCYGNAKTDDYDYTETIPAFTTSGNASSRIIEIDTYVQGDNATFYVDNSAKADTVTVQELREDLEQEITDRQNAIIDVEHGGTGVTTQGAINKNIAKIIPLLENDPTDDTLLVMRGANDTLSDSASLFTRKAVSVWNYIKTKISTVLGLTETSYNGNSASADVSKAPISARVKISTFSEEKPYALLAKFKDSAVSNNDMNLTFYVLQETTQTHSKKILYIMNLSARWSNNSIAWLDWECLYSATGKNPDLTLVYNHTTTDMQFEIYGKFTTSYQQWRIIPIINSSGDYGANPLSLHKWTYSDTKGTGADVCVALPTVNLPTVKEMTNPTSPVIHGLSTQAKQDENGNNIVDTYATKSEVSTTYATKSEVSKVESDAWGITKNKISSELGLTASQYNGNAKYSSYADSANKASYASNANTGLTGKVYTCSTASGTQEKTISVFQYNTLEKGDSIRVCFTNGNGIARPTLNVNSTGAKEIVVPNGNSVKTLSSQYGSSTTGAFKWNNNTVLELYYNGSYWVVMNNPIVYSQVLEKSRGYIYIDGKKEQDGYFAGTTDGDNSITYPFAFNSNYYALNVQPIVCADTDNRVMGYAKIKTYALTSFSCHTIRGNVGGSNCVKDTGSYSWHATGY